MRSNTIDSKPDMGLRLPVSTLQEEEEEEGLADENGIIHDDPGMKPIWNLIIEYGNTGMILSPNFLMLFFFVAKS